MTEGNEPNSPQRAIENNPPLALFAMDTVAAIVGDYLTHSVSLPSPLRWEWIYDENGGHSGIIFRRATIV